MEKYGSKTEVNSTAYWPFLKPCEAKLMNVLRKWLYKSYLRSSMNEKLGKNKDKSS